MFYCKLKAQKILMIVEKGLKEIKHVNRKRTSFIVKTQFLSNAYYCHTLTGLLMSARGLQIESFFQQLENKKGFSAS